MRYWFRMAGFAMAILFHVLMYVLTIEVLGKQTGGLSFILWFGASLLLGLPWSALTLTVNHELFVWLGLAGSVCVNGYLLGWLVDWLDAVSSGRLRRRS